MNNVERNKEVQFEIYSKQLNRKVIKEPDGWNNNFLSFEKDKDTGDVVKSIGVDLVFSGEGAEYLKSLYYGHGVFPICFSTKKEKNRIGITEDWRLADVQRIDLTTFDYDRSKNTVKVKAYEGGLMDLIKNRWDDEVNILNDYSIDGEYIGKLKYVDFQATPRNILLKSLLEGTKTGYQISSGYYNTATVYTGRPVPFEIKFESDQTDDIRVPTLTQDAFNNNSGSVGTDPTVGFTVGSDMPFFFEAEEYKELDIVINGKFKIERTDQRHVDGSNFLDVRYVKSKRGSDGTQKVKEFTNFVRINVSGNKGVEYSVNETINETLEEGESLSLIFSQLVRIDRGLNTDSGYSWLFLTSDFKISVTDVTKYPPRINRAIKPYDLIERLLAKILGRTGVFRSELFGLNGEFEGKLIDNGLIARGFPDLYVDESEEDQEIQLNTSLKEVFDSYSAIHPLCMVNNKENGLEVIRIEKDIYTQQNFVGIEIENVNDIQEVCDKNSQFSTIELGHDGSLEYESVNGLDEPIGKSKFSTHLGTGTSNKYIRLSKFRFDPTAYEQTRRLNFENFPYEDSDYDDDIWIHDCKIVNGIWYHRNWRDDFSSKPKGIFDPDSMWNLRHSPMQLLLRGHGRSIRRCIYHNEEKYIRFAGSNANQNLITFVDGVEFKENGDIQIKQLPVQRVKADKYTMTVNMTQELRNKFEGFNDAGVRNIFGLIKFYYKGEPEFGRIIKLSEGNESKLELIKAGI